LIVFLVSVSSYFTFSLDYWFKDYYLDGEKTIVYFFKDLYSFEEATSIEIGNLKNWVNVSSMGSFIPADTVTIFNEMISGGFVGAFHAFEVEYNPVYGRTMYTYYFYILPYGRNGTKYIDMPDLKNPINFPRR